MSESERARKDSAARRVTPADFLFGATLGEGAYARVVHAKMKSTGEEYAVKIMEKRFIKKENKVKFVMMERKVFSKLNNERIVKLYFTFQDQSYLYMVMELCRGGELLNVITHFRDLEENKGAKDHACSLEMTKFYMAEVIEALQYLHEHGIIHRDLKPENILLTDDGHLKLTDFGTAKDESDDQDRQNTFCGTAEYVSPEILRDEDAGRGSDLWAVGCMIFQMLVGRPMFRGENEYLTFQKILHHPEEGFEYPEAMPDVARDLCDKLLLQHPSDRLGAGTDEEGNGYHALKSHPFFEGIEWGNLDSQAAPYVPESGNLPEANNDGANENWLFLGVATELQSAVRSPKEIVKQMSYEDNTQNRGYEQNPSQGARSGSVRVQNNSIWSRFLLDNENIVFQAPISKRRGLFSKKRELILTDTPRLIYIDANKMRQKGEIPWSNSMYVQVRNQYSFDVVTPKRTYHLTDNVHGAETWAEKIRVALLKPSN